MMYVHRHFPLITCMLVTAKGRFELARQSIRCFIDQTYTNKELLIVNEGPEPYQRQIQTFVDSLGRNDIRCCWLRGEGEYTLGGLRNIAVGLSRGEIVVQWDDDDFSMPQRLSAQYAFMKKQEGRVCWLSDQLHYYWPTQQLYWDNWAKYHSSGHKEHSLIPGTLMAYKATLQTRYPSVGENCRAGEDTDFADDLLLIHGEAAVLLEGMGFMQMYTYHGNQVYDLDHHMFISENRSEARDHLLHYRRRIVDAIEYLKLPGVIKVMGSDGLAFTYERA